MKVAIIEPNLWAQKLIRENIINFELVSIYKDFKFKLDEYSFCIIGPSLSKLSVDNNLLPSKTIIILTEINFISMKKIILDPPYCIMHLNDITELSNILQLLNTNQIIFSLTFNQIICHQPSEPLLSLTRSEKIIFKFILAGFSNKEIAAINYKSVLTIETHRKNIKSKLEIKGSINDYKDKMTPYLAWLLMRE